MPGSPMIPLQHRRQDHSASCLAACVVMVLSHHRVEISEVEARRILKTKPYSGTHPVNLLRLSDLGFDAWPYEGTEAELRQRIFSGFPVISFLWTGALKHWARFGGADYIHTVVVVGYSATVVSIHDPVMSEGPTEISWVEFKESWQYSRQMMAVIEAHLGHDE